jgi:hypothetical protein
MPDRLLWVLVVVACVAALVCCWYGAIAGNAGLL